MIRTFITFVLAAFAFSAFAAVDLNKATQAELESIKGIGPSMSGRMLDGRKNGTFKDWTDLVDRVKGVGAGNAAKFSNDGLTVNGGTYVAAPVVAKVAAPKKDAASGKAKAKVELAEPAGDTKAARK